MPGKIACGGSRKEGVNPNRYKFDAKHAPAIVGAVMISAAHFMKETGDKKQMAKWQLKVGIHTCSDLRNNVPSGPFPKLVAW